MNNKDYKYKTDNDLLKDMFINKKLEEQIINKLTDEEGKYLLKKFLRLMGIGAFIGFFFCFIILI